MYNVEVCLGKQLLNSVSNVTPTHGRVNVAKREVESVGHEL
jgi:hypothetical protein